MRYSGLGVHSLGPVGDFLENKNEVVYKTGRMTGVIMPSVNDSTYKGWKTLVELMIGPHNSIDN